MNKVYERIKALRNQKGYSQEYMADKLSMAQNNYGKLERGLIQLTIERLEEIAILLDTETGVLLGFRSEMESAQRVKELDDKLKESGDRLCELEQQIEEYKSKLDNASLYLIESYNFLRYIFDVFLDDKLSKLPPQEITLEKINKLWISSVSFAYDDREKMRRLDLHSPLRLGLGGTDIRDTIQLLRNNLWNFLRTILPPDDPRRIEKFH